MLQVNILCKLVCGVFLGLGWIGFCLVHSLVVLAWAQLLGLGRLGWVCCLDLIEVGRFRVYGIWCCLCLLGNMKCMTLLTVLEVGTCFRLQQVEYLLLQSAKDLVREPSAAKLCCDLGFLADSP